MNWSRRDWLILLAVTLLAASLRLYQLGTVPPGFQFDEAFNAVDADQVLKGNRPLFLPANAGREVIYTYWQALLAALLGLNVRTLRLASAIAGIVTVPVTYVLLRGILRTHSRRTALFASLTLAISLWHVHFSRYGIRVILVPILFSAAFGFLWLGVHSNQRKIRLAAYVLSGVFTGLSVWTHPTGRLAPIILAGFVLWVLWRDPRQRRWYIDGPLAGLALAGVAAFVVFLPLGLVFYDHPEFFLGHASEVSIFAERVGGDSPVLALALNILRVVGMFSVRGDLEWTHNLAGRPVFEPLLSIAFYIGLAIWLWRIIKSHPKDPELDVDADALFLLALWALVMLLPSVLSEAAPNYSRTLPAMPALFVACGLGLTWFSIIERPWPWAGSTLAALILVVSAVQMTYDYFERFPRFPEVYYMYDADKLEALDYLRPFTQDNEVYLSQLWGDKHATVSLLRGAMGIKSFDTSDTMVLPPPGKGAIYAFPAEQAERAEQVAAIWPESFKEEVLDPFGGILLINVVVDAGSAAGLPATYTPTEFNAASFSEAPTLIGMQTEAQETQVTLFWRADQPMSQSLTSFLHLIDSDGHRVGQVDKLPGNGSYPTTAWSPGERVLDRYYPHVLDRCAGEDLLRAQVGWYELADDHSIRTRSDGPGSSALAGYVTLPIVSYPPAELAPQSVLNIPLSTTLMLLGYRASGSELQAGSPLLLDLYWQSDHAEEQPSPSDLAIALEITDGTYRSVLWRDSLAPNSEWDSGEAICRRTRIRLPDNLEPGVYQLVLTAAAGEFMQEGSPIIISRLEVGESTRLFAPPELHASANAHLIDGDGVDEIQLLGIADLRVNSPKIAGSDTFSITLVWRATTPPQGNYKAFVHVTDDTGVIVAQSDSVPNSGYATNRWLAGEVVLDTHVVYLPYELEQAEYHIVVGLYDPISNARLFARDSMDRPIAGNAVPLGTFDLRAIPGSPP